jgi:hypothetical protein
MKEPIDAFSEETGHSTRASGKDYSIITLGYDSCPTGDYPYTRLKRFYI